jgi:hypothetical protein
MVRRVNDEGGCFCIDSVSKQNVAISVNVPDDEYGGSHNVVAYFPLVGNPKQLRGVVLASEFTGKIVGLTDDDPDLYQLFMQLFDCPELHWSPFTGGWYSKDELLPDGEVASR